MLTAMDKREASFMTCSFERWKSLCARTPIARSFIKHGQIDLDQTYCCNIFLLIAKFRQPFLDSVGKPPMSFSCKVHEIRLLESKKRISYRGPERSRNRVVQIREIGLIFCCKRRDIDFKLRVLGVVIWTWDIPPVGWDVEQHPNVLVSRAFQQFSQYVKLFSIDRRINRSFCVGMNTKHFVS